jgi:hypothetical protein
MIQFNQFVKIIHEAAQAANRAIMDDNLTLIDTYFENSDGSAIVKEENVPEYDENFYKKIIKKDDPSESDIELARKSYLRAKKEILKRLKDEQYDDNQHIRPKTILMEFPQLTSEGVVIKTVKVPLIALVPVTTTRISKIKFKTDLEVMVDNDNDLIVSFINKKSDVNNEKTAIGLPTSSIEITIHPEESSEGLKDVIKGYEKLLRSQIPN